jgi:hypothetical protein
VILRLQNLLTLLTAYFQGTKVTRLAAFLLFVVHGFVLAAEPESAFSLSGFGNLAVGKILRGTSDPATNLGYGCPCYIADYAQNAVYEGKVFRFKPDSKLGLQGQWNSPEKQYSVTAQIISRGAANGNMNVEWWGEKDYRCYSFLRCKMLATHCLGYTFLLKFTVGKS